jgi:O-antigen ligase
MNLAAGKTVSPGTVLCSRVMLILSLALLGATFFLISPPPGETYPGAIPWSDLSVLRPLTELMSLHRLVGTVRGVEIKDVAFHLAAALGLLLLGVRQLVAPGSPGHGRRPPAAYAQILLAGWVLLSLLSSLWAGDPGIARGQALLYALSLGWAVAIAGTLERRHLPALLYGVMAITAAGGALCVWYYYERNPFHRPGFPLGNPTLLAAAMLPGLLIAYAILVEGLTSRLSGKRASMGWPALGAEVALIPLIWCFVLAQGRGAMLGLVAGLVAMGVFLVGRKLRWALSIVCVVGIIALGLWWFSASHLDVAMARGPSARLRLYAWRYAAELWGKRPMAGCGAGAYPCLAGELAVRDRALDPAAFMGELVEHAHNELFEILTEIGLVGGVTFVAGLVATVFAASALVRSRPPGPERWLVLGLIGSVGALLGDAMTGVTLRLPGGAAIFYTLLGTLWAISPGSAAEPGGGSTAAAPMSPLERWASQGLARKILASGACAAIVCLIAGMGAGWLALRNWNGVRLEQGAYVAADSKQERPDAALSDILAAEPRLLDPVRVVAARRLGLDARLALAREAFATWRAAPTTAPSGDDWQPAVTLAERAYTDTEWLGQTVPAWTENKSIQAQAAELLAELYRTREPQISGQWARQAWQAWRRQRERTPYDVETLLALTRYPASLSDQVGLLRDALRFGEPQGVWLTALERLGQVPGFEDALGRYAAAAGPITPQTDLDALIASMAPETQRLLAAWLALHGDYAAAADRSAQAAAMYQPMRARFPELESRALAEEASYRLAAEPQNPASAIELMKAAIADLPVIQAQKYAEMVRPYRERLALCLLAAGKEEEAREVLRAAELDGADLNEALGEAYVDLATVFVRRPAEGRPPVRDWLQAALRFSPRNLRAWSWLGWLDAERGDAEAVRTELQAAARAGVPADGVTLIRRSLCQEFPAICEAIGGSE